MAAKSFLISALITDQNMAGYHTIYQPEIKLQPDEPWSNNKYFLSQVHVTSDLHKSQKLCTNTLPCDWLMPGQW